MAQDCNVGDDRHRGGGPGMPSPDPHTSRAAHRARAIVAAGPRTELAGAAEFLHGLLRTTDVASRHGREPGIIGAFVALTDALVGDSPDMLSTLAEHSVELLGVTAAGIMTVDDGSGGLSVAAAGSEVARLLGEFAVAIDDGPGRDCVRSGEPVVVRDIVSAPDRARWPRFGTGATECGFRALHAIPMRHRDRVLGVLTLLHSEPHTLSGPDVHLAQALADAAATGLVHRRAVRGAEATTEQLQHALDSRVVIEQAKGSLAQHAGISVDDAFRLLRDHSRNNNTRLIDVCCALVEGTLAVTALALRSRTEPPPRRHR